MTDKNFDRLYEESIAELGFTPVKLAKLQKGQLTGNVESDRETIEQNEEEINPILQQKAKSFIELCKGKGRSKRWIRRAIERKFKITIV